ncbi:dethiobiotin synthase [Acetobacter sp. AN02]|uniref:dethiobiotin synthase n=1 Tax=Acetobacter sp. AN02 TaxID=2894186 RepID=UPI00243419AE|nr:dethiobiotin synthase [Acetobacter sp. AN02]MDG6095421.1 dethiobiotin synthase [Acetobacter sp. AN02]
MTHFSSASVRERFSRASGYDRAASLQACVARNLAAQLERSGIKPLRILEFGCGTGLLTQHLRRLWPQADILATDISPEMLERARNRLRDSVRYAVMDAQQPSAEGPFDLICGSLALQWCPDRAQVLHALRALLSPGGTLAVTTLAEGCFAEWREACATARVPVSLHDYPSAGQLAEDIPADMSGRWETQIISETGDGLSFLRRLHDTGAAAPRAGQRPLSAGALRRVLNAFDEAEESISWTIASGMFRTPARAGVFVTGTDTGVGKTFVSACLVRAWNALYWKPLQTGLADEAGDTPVVRELAQLTPDRIILPFAGFAAPLAPDAAAALEGVSIQPDDIRLPLQDIGTPLVVEGAGGVLVPVAPGVMMADLMQRFGLPVVLVARSGLGTISHTLLSLAELRRRGIAVLGVVLNGPLNPGNREAIERNGRVRILAETDFCPEITPEAVADAARLFPAWPTSGLPDPASSAPSHPHSV